MKHRLDKLIHVKGLAQSREQAHELILSGLVEVGGLPAVKPASLFEPDCHITIRGEGCPYVSRGGVKLEAGLEGFHIAPTGFVCADIGASTGGFSDCLLQRGAAKVYAIDVGYGQLHWRLRQDPRVVVMERTNARNLTPADLHGFIDLAVVDASFISLKILLPPLLPLFQAEIAILALIKPQFEVGRGKVGKGGVVRDAELHQTVTSEILSFAQSLGLESQGVIPSPILGPKGNQEFLSYFTGRSNMLRNGIN